MTQAPSTSRTTQFPDAAALADKLQADIRGEVRFDDAYRTMFSFDASHYSQSPIGWVAPRDGDDLERAVAICREHDAPILMRGTGTSLAGQGCNAAVILDTSRFMNRILEIDPERRIARVQPGVVLDELRNAAEKAGPTPLTFGPDPSTHAWCTLGGMIGNNSCGVHSLMAGKTVDNVESLRVLTYDGQRLDLGPTDDEQLDQLTRRDDRIGQIYRDMRQLRDQIGDQVRAQYPDIPRRVAGYNLDELLAERGFNVARALVGSEGTLGIIEEATLRLVPSPPVRTLVVLGYDDLASAADDVPRMLRYGPIGLESMGQSLIENMRAKRYEPEGVRMLPPGHGWLFVEFGADDRDQANKPANQLLQRVQNPSADEPRPSVTMFEDPTEARKIWAIREDGLGASARLADHVDTWEGWEDAAVHPDRLGDYLRDFEALIERFGYRCTLYGHFGQGLVHNRIDFDLATRQGIAHYRRFVEEGADLVVGYGGSITGEHGDGQSRAELLAKMYSPPIIDAFRKFKTIWDPDHRLNPHKVVEPYRLDENLHLGPDYQLPQVESRFAFPEDEGSFARATARCIGVGKCRRDSGGTMCPSYMVTHQEQHATRGRARLLHEMTEGNLPDGWQNEQIKQSLDLCLSCKGCKHDCPASVDVATYKSEFLSHYYEHRRRPRSAYAFGMIDRWGRLTTAIPGVASIANALNRTPGFSDLAKAMTGMAKGRAIPPFAATPFTRWFKRQTGNGQASAFNGHDDQSASRRRVLLWPDTFHNYLHPEPTKAAVKVLEQAGCHVILPSVALCCGRPLYDFGMLDRARAKLETIIESLDEELRRGTPLVGLEPSCLSVFRDELGNLMPNDERAQRLRDQTYTFAEFLTSDAMDYQPPHLASHVLFHGHCHQKAVLSTDQDLDLLGQMGLSVETPITGCCGMAGSFGYERENEPISKQIGERVLLPEVRRADEATYILTDGFSCRQQIQAYTDRCVWSLPELLAHAAGEGASVT